jgi:hypothetical protein
MIELSQQKDFRKVRDLPFCYLCGKTFYKLDATNHDHVPPKSVFKITDRNIPLKLKVHKEGCHSPINLDDEVLGQLICLFHGKQPDEQNDKLKIDIYQKIGSGELLASFTQRNIEFLLKRWLKGFHAALYRTPIPEGTKFAIQSPFPSGTLKDGHFDTNPIEDQHYAFVECIKRNRAARNLDTLVANNEKLRYECVWDQLSDKSWGCIFAIDLYGWIDLGDTNNFLPRGCAGLYSMPDGKAPCASSLATKLQFKLANIYRTDPFGI